MKTRLTSNQKASLRALLFVGAVLLGAILMAGLCSSCESKSGQRFNEIQNAPYDIEFEPFEVIDVDEAFITFHKDTSYNSHMMGIVNYRVPKHLVKTCQDNNGMYFKTKSVVVQIIGIDMIDPSEFIE